jgi:hypothetical protein
MWHCKRRTAADKGNRSDAAMAKEVPHCEFTGHCGPVHFSLRRFSGGAQHRGFDAPKKPAVLRTAAKSPLQTASIPEMAADFASVSVHVSIV